MSLKDVAVLPDPAIPAAMMFVFVAGMTVYVLHMIVLAIWRRCTAAPAKAQAAVPTPNLAPRPVRNDQVPSQAHAQPAREQDNSDGDLLTSAVVATATGSSLLGYAAGGSLAGAIIGEALSEHHDDRREDADHDADRCDVDNGGSNDGDSSSCDSSTSSDY